MGGEKFLAALESHDHQSRAVGVGLRRSFRDDRGRKQAAGYGLPRSRIDRMDDLSAARVGAELAVVARCGESFPAQRDFDLQVGSRREVAFLRPVDPDDPWLALGVEAPAENLSSDLDHVFLDSQFFEIGCDIVRRSPLRDRVQVDLHAGIGFPQAAVLDGDLVVSDQLEQRIDVGVLYRYVAREAIGCGERLDGDVVGSVRLFADTPGGPDTFGDETVYRIRFVAVQPAEQRLRVVERHRVVYLGQQAVDLVFHV